MAFIFRVFFIGVVFVASALFPVGSVRAAVDDLKYEREASTGAGFTPSQTANPTRGGKVETVQEIFESGRGRLSRGPNGDYLYANGRGIFTIENTAGKTSSSARLVVDGGVRARDIEIRKIGDDLVICMNGLSGRVDFPGWYDGDRPIQSLVFADGTEWSANKIESRAVYSEPLRNLTVVQIENKIEGTDKNDVLLGTDKNDVFIPGPGDDIMAGVGGCNVYFYEPGGGNDTIHNTGSTGIGGILRFHEDIVSTDVKISRQGADVLLTLSDGSVLVKGWYSGATAKLGRVEFVNDMTTYDVFDVELLASGKQLILRDEYYDTTVVTKPYDEYRKSVTPDANGGTER